MNGPAHSPLFWGVAVFLFVLVLWLVSTMFVFLWHVWRSPEPPLPLPLYDWAADDGLLDVWARDEEGELVAVFPTSWLHR
jgi:hypothetical protein